MAEWAKIGDFRTDDLGLDLYNLSIGAPKIKTSYINLPLESKVLDLSDVVTGRPSYGARTITLYLGKKDRSPRNWIKTATELASKIHGKRLPITLSIDQDYYYLGRIQCSSDKISFMRSTYEITATCDPYKYAQTESIVLCGAGTTAVLNNGDEIVSPTFTASETGMTVALNGSAAYSIAQVGKAVKIPELLLLPGANNVTVTGTGNVVLTWREGVL